MVDVFACIRPINPVVDGWLGSVEINITTTAVGIHTLSYGTSNCTNENRSSKKTAAIYFDVIDAFF